MNNLKIEVWDVTGNKRVMIEAPDDVPVERVLVVLVDKLRLPRHNPTGEFMSYKFHHRRLGVQLLDDKTLGEQQVENGDVLRIQPEITAGRGTS
ncbi:MAG TPA: EsaB/YukD family protein [Blastocatellia bacterium]|nr:EsaB/YukD family protein [Blastocatellia bacterium]